MRSFATEQALYRCPSDRASARCCYSGGVTPNAIALVLIAGPTTLWAILNSLQMGFRTLAIQKRSSEVWKVLGAVKTEFGNFGGLLDGVKKKLDQASNNIDDAAKKSRTIERRLRTVQELPVEEAKAVLLLETVNGDGKSEIT